MNAPEVRRERTPHDFERVTVSANALFRDELIAAGIGNLSHRLNVLADQDGPILIEGPSGAGKSSLAIQVHNNSPRSKKVCIQHGCGDFDTTTFSATLFGHRSGAFTGAEKENDGLLHHADGGTLILDDIDYLEHFSQRRLLRFLDDGKFHRLGEPEKVRSADIRVIATTNKNLKSLVREGHFLSDLFFRLRRFVVRLPPLNRRRGTPSRVAVRLFKKFLEASKGTQACAMEDALLKSFDRMQLDGNFRELRDIVENLILFAEPDRSGVITHRAAAEALPEYFVASAVTPEIPSERSSTDDDVILAILKQTDWNISAASRMIGCSRTTIYSRIRANGWVRGRV